MTILVTGATGNVGRHLVQHLLELGQEVRCLTRNPEKAQLPPGAEVVAGDLLDPATLDDALAGITGAHLITFAGGDYTPIPGGEEILRRLEDAGATRVTVLKGDAEESAIEQAARLSPVESTVLAPVEFMANMLEWADGVRAGRIEEGFVDVPSTVIHEADIAAVAAHVLINGGHNDETLWITGPEALTVRERVDIINQALDLNVDLVPLDDSAIQEQWRSYGFTEDDVAYMTMVKTDPPEAARVPQETVWTVTGRQPRTFQDWVLDHRQELTGIVRG